MENSFLPDSYEKPAGTGKYYKLQQGDNRFRIVSSAIVGWEDWSEENDNGKIVRTPIRTKEKPAQLIDPKKPAKHFWAFVIWDYADSSLKIMEVTQSTIQDAIFNLHSDANWGDPKNYDLNIKKTGEKMETKYSVMPAPPRPLAPEATKAIAETKIDLNKLYENGDPFEGESINNDMPPVIDEQTLDDSINSVVF